MQSQRESEWKSICATVAFVLYIFVNDTAHSDDFQDFETWPTTASWGTTTHEGWTLSDGQVKVNRGGFGPPIDVRCGWLHDYDDSTDSWLQSPLFPTGILTVVFWSRRDISSGGSNSAALEISSNEIDWITCDTLNMSSTVWTQHLLLIDIDSPTYFRIRKTGDTAVDSYSGIDNIVVVGNTTTLTSTTSTTTTSSTTTSPAVARGPYLQISTPSSMTVKWRTEVATDSRVVFGTELSNLSGSVTDSNVTIDHELTITGLVSRTKYFYAVGTSSANIAGPDISHFFYTAPSLGDARQTRVWVIGDSGTANYAPGFARDTYSAYTGTNYTDVWLMLGDNAYNIGSDEEYQDAVFLMFPELLRTTALWPTLGNHDAFTADSATQSGPYYDIFSLPDSGQAGGLASGTEAYYSFDYANIHFVCLDSSDTDRSTNGTMMTWLQNDLASTMKDWIIAYWHHPPYSKGTHNSDLEIELIEMRQNALPILEDAGVDLVLCGHSHVYERSYYLHGHYGHSTSLDTNIMIVSAGDGRIDSDGAYVRQSTTGTVYVVAGCSGQTGSGSLDHPVMFYSLGFQHGSLILDIADDTLNATFLDIQGVVRDYFTISKFLDLTVDIPESAVEGSGTLVAAGCVALPRVAETNYTITLSSDDPTELVVPTNIVILAGNSNATFDITVVDDLDLDGSQVVALSAMTDGFGDGSNTMAITDNEIASLMLAAPAVAMEGDGVLVGQGELYINEIPDTDISVAITSADTTEVVVPAFAIIPAAQTNTSFDITIVDDSEIDGTQNTTITTHVPNWTNGQDGITVLDNDVVEDFLVSPISSPQIGGVLFEVSIVARDINGATVTVYFGTADLSGTGNEGPVAVLPEQAGPFSAGVWNGFVSVNDLMTNVSLTASKSGRTGTSNPFDVTHGPLDYFEWNPIASPQCLDLPFPVTITAKDTNGYTVIDYTNSVSIYGLVGEGTASTIVITEIDPSTPDFIEIQNVSQQTVDSSGWILAVSDSYVSRDSVNPVYWFLPASISPGQVLYRTDSPVDNYWGRNLFWNNGQNGWAVILDDSGTIVDFVAWTWSAGDIQNMSPTINGYAISVGDEFSGNGVSSSGVGSVQRQGDQDHNDASDFVLDVLRSKGIQNTGMTTPFTGGITNFTVNPTHTYAFTAGQWSDTVAISMNFSNMWLRAETGIGLMGESTTFDVVSTIGGTTPRIVSIQALGDSTFLLMWNSVSDAVYTVYHSTNLQNDWPGLMLTNAIPGHYSGTNIFMHTNGVLPESFYKIEAGVQ